MLTSCSFGWIIAQVYMLFFIHFAASYLNHPTLGTSAGWYVCFFFPCIKVCIWLSWGKKIASSSFELQVCWNITAEVPYQVSGFTV